MQSLNEIILEQTQNWLARADNLMVELRLAWGKETLPQERDRLDQRINQLAQDITHYEETWVKLKLDTTSSNKPDSKARLYQKLARAHADAENYTLAIAAYNRAVENSRNFLPSLYQEKAVILARTGRWQEAINDFDLILRRSPNKDNLEALLGKGIAFYQLGNFKEAEEYLNQAQELARRDEYESQELLALSFLAANSMVQKLPEPALKYLIRAIELGETHADRENLSSLYYNRGLVYQFMESDTRAARDFATAVGLNPKNEQAQKELAKYPATLTPEEKLIRAIFGQFDEDEKPKALEDREEPELVYSQTAVETIDETTDEENDDDEAQIENRQTTAEGAD